MVSLLTVKDLLLTIKGLLLIVRGLLQSVKELLLTFRGLQLTVKDLPLIVKGLLLTFRNRLCPISGPTNPPITGAIGYSAILAPDNREYRKNIESRGDGRMPRPAYCGTQDREDGKAV